MNAWMMDPMDGWMVLRCMNDFFLKSFNGNMFEKRFSCFAECMSLQMGFETPTKQNRSFLIHVGHAWSQSHLRRTGTECSGEAESESPSAWTLSPLPSSPHHFNYL